MNAEPFLEFVRMVVANDTEGVSKRLKATPELALAVSPVGATRLNSKEFFFESISHYLYAGDTALHLAAAAFSRTISELLHQHGADCRARNRRGAEPLHYASDGGTGEVTDQEAVIRYLLSIGAEPNALDKSGVAPLHRAVRSRSLGAVRALLEGGADPRMRNKGGSSPLHLAVQDTGASGTGSPSARQNQEEIIKLLLGRGATPFDQDARGKSVSESAVGKRVKALLGEWQAGNWR